MPPTGSLPPPSLLVAASFHRSGSTLLQRYVTAATDTFVWGENGLLGPALRSVLRNWPQEAHNERDYAAVMADPDLAERKFLPNLAPPREHVHDVLRRTVSEIYRDIPRSFRSWGWKAVRYGRGEIDLVRSLFPDIRILLLVRNPWDVARSIRRKGWIDRRGWFEDMAQVANLWAERTAGFLELGRVGDENVHLVRYESLEQRITELNAFLGVEGDGAWREVSKLTLGAAPAFSRYDLTPEDVETIERIAGDVASDLGYTCPASSLATFSLSV